jgi:hypothetical protein
MSQNVRNRKQITTTTTTSTTTNKAENSSCSSKSNDAVINKHNNETTQLRKQNNSNQVPTAEQIRLASITFNNNTNQDTELMRKIRQVQDIVPHNEDQDFITLALHQNDYDVEQTINFLLEGGKPNEEWQTAGRSSSSSTATNTTSNVTNNKKTEQQHNASQSNGKTFKSKLK